MTPNAVSSIEKRSAQLFLFFPSSPFFFFALHFMQFLMEHDLPISEINLLAKLIQIVPTKAHKNTSE